MKCYNCGTSESKVIDSRPTDDGSRIRRRRECLKCAERFTTFEAIESVPIIIVKKDKSHEVFNSQKLLSGLMKACEKRPVPYERLEAAVNNIEHAITETLERKITSVKLGELAMDELRAIDDVAYIRFVSVYRQFTGIDTFMDELKKLQDHRLKETEK